MKNCMDMSLPDAKASLEAQNATANKLLGKKVAHTLVELHSAYGAARKKHPIPRVGRYGNFWHYDADEQWICCDAGGHHYQIDLDDFSDRMPLHLVEKVWYSEQAAGDLIYMLRKVFKWQSLSRAGREKAKPKAKG